MERKVVEAAKRGDVSTLHNMIKDNPFLLRDAALFDGDNTLHIACIGGNLDFVKDVLNLRPEFALELNQDGFSPLHMASANGDLEIVKELLKVGCHLCLVKGKDGRIPLHCAVSKGRMQAIEELLLACLDSFQEVTARGENCFHLAVKNNRFEAFNLLVEFAMLHDKVDVLSKRDERGNTILHVAAYQKQYEVLNFLMDENFNYNGKFEDINSLNKSGLTPLDVLLSQGGDCDIEEMLRAAGARRVQEIQSHHDSIVSIQNPSLDQFEREQTRDRSQSASKKFIHYLNSKNEESPSAVRNTMLVIAILIATATYQAVLSPPGGVWQDDFPPVVNLSAKQPPSHTAGNSIMATQRPRLYCQFLVFNSIGFFTSLYLMVFLTRGLPLQAALMISLVAVAITYVVCMAGLIAVHQIYFLFFAICFAVSLIILFLIFKI